MALEALTRIIPLEHAACDDGACEQHRRLRIVRSAKSSASRVRAVGAALALVAGVACASTHPPRAQSWRSDTMQPLHFTDELVEGSHGLTIEDDPLPPTFARLSPREREQWHVCRPLMAYLRQGRDCVGLQDQPYFPSLRDSLSTIRARHDTGGQIVFSLHAADYVALPDAAARRASLLRAGCPEALLDLADGTHLDVVEAPGLSPR